MRYDQFEQSIPMSLRLDEALRERLIEAAKRSVRSLNGEIVYRLRSTFEGRGADQGAA